MTIHYRCNPDGTSTPTEPCDLTPICFGVAKLVAGLESALLEVRDA
jgi:hypothetical protein